MNPAVVPVRELVPDNLSRFSPTEAGHVRIRADIMIERTRIIEARELTQAAVAKLRHVTQPRDPD